MRANDPIDAVAKRCSGGDLTERKAHRIACPGISLPHGESLVAEGLEWLGVDARILCGMTTATETTVPSWMGMNHLALVTTDMDATTRFWHGVLGAHIVATVATDSFKHYFFRIGEAQTIAFFQYLDADIETFAKPAGIPHRLASQFDHLSLGLPDEAALEDLRARLIAAGCEVTEVVDHGFIRSIYFSDPTGIALEASWWTSDLDAPGYEVPGRFLDDDPVPALRELLETGSIADTPSTRLVNEFVAGPTGA
jgi:catechol 2,3-dioxygenase-like lactoylglutathione lyase family enzyme